MKAEQEKIDESGHRCEATVPSGEIVLAEAEDDGSANHGEGIQCDREAAPMRKPTRVGEHRYHTEQGSDEQRVDGDLVAGLAAVELGA